MKQPQDQRDVVRILIVEDEPDYADLIRQRIESGASEPISVQLAGSLADALEAIAAAPFDFVLLDLGLPDSGGVPTLERIRQAAPEAPVVVLTGMDDPSVGARCIELGAQSYLVKGCMESAVSGVIHNAVAAEFALRKVVDAHENLKHVLDGSRDAILVLAESGRLMFANQTATELFAGRMAEGQDIGLLLESDHTQDLAVPQPDGSVLSVEMRTGQTTWLGASAMIVTFRDVTERKRADDQMAAQLDELQRWHELTLGRETRVIELKHEVNELLAKAGQPARYSEFGTGNAEVGPRNLEQR